MLRLRQICLVAPALEPVVEQVRHTFGLDVCHRDEAVAKYGLVNALFVFGHQFLEIVAPTAPHTAAGRFLERSGGMGGYMLIFDSADPEVRRAHIEALGVRVANVLEAPGFHGIQLHPRDTRATMLEIDRSDGNEQLAGAYFPAGPHWRAQQRLDLVRGIPRVEVHTPVPSDLATHWSRILQVPLSASEGGQPLLSFDLGSVSFTTSPETKAERVAVLQVEVGDVHGVRARAEQAGLPQTASGFALAGVHFVLGPAAT